MASGYRDFTFDFSPLATLPALAEQARAREALKGLGSVDFSNPGAIKKIAGGLLQSNPQLAVQLLDAANRQQALLLQYAPVNLPEGILTSTPSPYESTTSTPSSGGYIEHKGQKIPLDESRTPAALPLNELPPSGDLSPPGTSLFSSPGAVTPPAPPPAAPVPGTIQEQTSLAPWQVASAGQDIPVPSTPPTQQVAQATPPPAGAPLAPPPSGPAPNIQNLQMVPAPEQVPPTVAPPAAEPSQMSSVKAQQLQAERDLRTYGAQLEALARASRSGRRIDPILVGNLRSKYDALQKRVEALRQQDFSLQGQYKLDQSKRVSEYYTKTYQADANTAQKALDILGSMKQAFDDPKLITGAGAEAVGAIGRAASTALGVARALNIPEGTIKAWTDRLSPALDATQRQEVVTGLRNTLVIAMLGGLGGRTVSDQDRVYQQAILGSVGGSLWGSKALTLMQTTLARRQVDLGEVAAKWIEAKGINATQAGLDAFMQRYVNEHPVFVNANGSYTRIGTALDKEVTKLGGATGADGGGWTDYGNGKIRLKPGQ